MVKRSFWRIYFCCLLAVSSLIQASEDKLIEDNMNDVVVSDTSVKARRLSGLKKIAAVRDLRALIKIEELENKENQALAGNHYPEKESPKTISMIDNSDSRGYLDLLIKAQSHPDEKYRQVIHKYLLIDRESLDFFVKEVSVSEVCQELKVTLPLSETDLPNASFHLPTLGLSEFWFRFHSPNQDLSIDQGWKLHISAMPESAYKIAMLVLPVLIGDLIKQTQPRVDFKLVATSGLLRTINYIVPFKAFHHHQGGKFLVIYPSCENDAYELAKEIDLKLLEALHSGLLVSDDFYPLTGDAQLGQSGGVYTRYGAFKSSAINIVMPANQYTSVNILQESIVDDRSRPWPNFINSSPVWRLKASPFRELSLTWYNRESAGVVEWDTRPLSW